MVVEKLMLRLDQPSDLSVGDSGSAAKPFAPDQAPKRPMLSAAAIKA